MRRRLASIIREEYSGRKSLGIIDDTGYRKKGDQTPGVQRQWCGEVGKQDNCIVTVHLGFAREGFHCLLDGELYIPKSWAKDSRQCQEAGIPETVTYCPKWQIALELYDRGVSNGVEFEWITADEGYGSKPGFLEGLAGRTQQFVVEVPRNLSVWVKAPEVTERPYRKNGRGRPCKTPRIKQGQPEPRSVEKVLWFSEAMKGEPWIKYYVKDTQKGPLVWEAKRVRVVLKGSDDLPSLELWLMVAHNVLKSEWKFFVSKADRNTDIDALLLVAFSRWQVERCFQIEKQEVGLRGYEGRRYLGLIRHLILTAVSHLFLATVRQEGKKSAGHDRAVETGNQR